MDSHELMAAGIQKKKRKNSCWLQGSQKVLSTTIIGGYNNAEGTWPGMSYERHKIHVVGCDFDHDIDEKNDKL